MSNDERGGGKAVVWRDPCVTDFGVRLRVELSWYVGYCERDLVLAKARRFFWRLNIGALQAGFGACFRSS